MAESAAVPVDESHHPGRYGGGGARRALRLTRAVKGAPKAASEVPASQNQARVLESTLAMEAGEGSSWCRLAV